MKTMIVNIDEPGECAWDGSPKTFEIKELVRCKDCKKYGDKKKCPIEALINSDSKQFFAFDENWFCADGKKVK